MARITKRDVPTQLPPSDIFLDDMAEIVEILTTEFNTLQTTNPPDHGDLSISFTYEVDEEYTFSSIEELATHGGKTSEFALKANIDTTFQGQVWIPYESTVVEFSGSSPVRIRLPYQFEASKWSAFARIERVFAERKSRLREFGRSLDPMNIVLVGYGLSFVVFVADSYFLAKFHKRMFLVGAIVGSLWMLTMLVGIYSIFRKNYVLLRFRREAGQEKAKSRNEMLAKTVWLVLAAALGATLKPIAEWLFTKWTH
jgi:hypothetical protein